MPTDPLLQPYTLKHLRIRNRIFLPAHEPAYAENGLPGDLYRAYHVERAKGGIGLTMTAGSVTVGRESAPMVSQIVAYTDEVVPHIRRLTDEVHEHGAAIMIQLSHLGRRSRSDAGDWLPIISSSHAREPAHRAFPKRMEDWDIERVISDFGVAAERMKAGGMDGVEINAYSHLLGQFWSPLTNDLEAPYGGSLENRLEFTFDILREVRRRCGDDFIVGIRYSADEEQDGGFSAHDGFRISRMLKVSGLVDFLNVVSGNTYTEASTTDMFPIMGMRSAPQLDFAGELRSATDFPTFHAAKIQDVATARHAIAAGKVDLIGMVRAHMADPHIVRKIMEGREEKIRPCVGANYCLDRMFQGGAAICIHNPSTGRETTLPHAIPKADRRRKVVVVGAGPAGLETARVSAERGHHVVVFELADKPGGQIRLTAQSKRRHEMIGIVDWRVAQCEELGVEFRYNTWAEETDVLAENPDVIVVATGGIADTAILDGGNDLVVSAWDIISGDVKPGSNVLIYDDAGDHAALQAAEIIAAGGSEVEIMTRDRSFSPEVAGMSLTPYLRALQAKSVRFTVTYRLKTVERDGNMLAARIGSDYLSVDHTRRVDQVVVNHGTLPLDDLYFALKASSINGGAIDFDAFIDGRAQTVVRNPEGKFQLFRIGDAVTSRNTHAAIYEGMRLARTL